MPQTPGATGPSAGLVESFLGQIRAYADLRAQMGTSTAGWRWSSGQQTCLVEGGLRGDGQPTLVDERLTLPKGVRSGSPKSCWANAWSLARSTSRRGSDGTLQAGRFLYVEGYAAALLPSGSALAVSHAWCLDLRTMEIVDPTWAGEGTLFRSRAHVYLGIAFSPAFMEAAVAETSRRGEDRDVSIFESDHRRQGRALRLGFRYGAPTPPSGGVPADVPLVIGWGDDETAAGQE